MPLGLTEEEGIARLPNKDANHLVQNIRRMLTS